MPKKSRRSAGILLYRAANGGIEILLAHPGGPVWAKRHAGAWSIPKGEIEEGEDPWDVARREFEEETGHPAPDGASIELGEITQKGGKVVVAWALEGDLDPATAHSNTFPFAWPPGFGALHHRSLRSTAWSGSPQTTRDRTAEGDAAPLHRSTAGGAQPSLRASPRDTSRSTFAAMIMSFALRPPIASVDQETSRRPHESVILG